MQEINVSSQLVSDPSGLILNGNCRVHGLRNSSLTFRLEDGVISLEGEGNPLPWRALFATPRAHSLRTSNCNSDCLYFLPENIKTILVDRYADLHAISGWLHDPHPREKGLTIEYDGAWEGRLAPLVHTKITSEVEHLLLPFCGGIEEMASVNPHLRSFGFDFDHSVRDEVLEREDLHFHIWSLHPHHHYIARRKHPRHTHRLLNDRRSFVSPERFSSTY